MPRCADQRHPHVISLIKGKAVGGESSEGRGDRASLFRSVRDLLLLTSSSDEDKDIESPSDPQEARHTAPLGAGDGMNICKQGWRRKRSPLLEKSGLPYSQGVVVSQQEQTLRKWNYMLWAGEMFTSSHEYTGPTGSIRTTEGLEKQPKALGRCFCGHSESTTKAPSPSHCHTERETSNGGDEFNGLAGSQCQTGHVCDGWRGIKEPGKPSCP
ncbi:hypothetical protein DPEC_G00335640 [Dallia pectoralis]|uniref:Uncharacterized protein n=1 Tax=Dallia pectoralis TaxID=75939 RepID=A0ACC2F715_DALPE|nr:hypothetical protein DPEC_G00335640 [Dallia pectoralis]